ncbi:SDR family NAD(P)-dependent oxidoreductase [Streptomyces sp. NBC_00872]|uniref:SDR family NAD(P)-dependent oxidoreductase n=1 Tax=Streptomyces sp. NBC_00872 TaxID=2903686 RepID=UPI00386353DF|nr:SDR family NAD(P)-dependent oxidoreductase [Streptomyces sp. NBC_00872]
MSTVSATTTATAAAAAAGRMTPEAIARIAADAAGVQDAAAVYDRRLRSPGSRRAAPGAGTGGVPAGTDVPADRPALVHGPEPVLPPDAVATLPQALARAARMAPGRGTTYLLPDGGTDRQTYAELYDEARRMLGGLRGHGLAAGDSVLLQCADSRTFVTAWWACVLGGFLPTPVAPAPEYATDNAGVRKLASAWELLDRPPVIADPGLLDGVRSLAARLPGGEALRVLDAGTLLGPEPADWSVPDPDELIVNLLTSGSTGTPKCVQHRHHTIVARTYAAIAANGFTEHEVSLNWMPLDHVGGMIMFNLRDVFLTCEHINVRTESVIRRPLLWLDCLDRFRATSTWAPNFAFSLVCQRAEEITAGGWDLRALTNVCNAGEAVVARTARRFLELLAPHGLPADAMVPCWGMSETSSGVTYARMRLDEPSAGTIALDPASLDGGLRELPAGTPGAVVVTEVGAPVPGVALRIVDQEGSVLPEGRVGRLHVSGRTVQNGYARNERANRESFTADGWFDTGDLGFLRDGRLFLTGRRKNMVIVNGANFPAHEIEAVVEQVPGVRPASSAVAGVPDEDTGTDALVVFFVPDTDDVPALVDAIRTALARDLALRPTFLVPVTAREFPRQNGGKVQRERLLEGWRDGRFDDRCYGRETDGAVAGTASGDGTGTSALAVGWEPAGTPLRPRSAGPLVACVHGPVAGWLDGVTDAVVPAGTDPARLAQDLERALEQAGGQVPDDLAGEDGGSVPQVLFVATGDPAAAPADGDTGVLARFLAVASALVRVRPGAELTVLTRGAAQTAPGDRVVPGRAGLTALVRTARSERLVARTALIDAPADAGEDELAALAGLRHDGDVVAVRDGAPLQQRLRTVPLPEAFDVPTDVLPRGGTCLLTGGIGGLGRTVAEYLVVAHGARLLIVGRTPEARLDTDAREALEILAAVGEVRYRQADAADADALAREVAESEASWGRGLDLVVHLAGAPVAAQWERLSEHELRAESADWLDRMLRPKAGGCAAVDRLLAARPDTAVILFSSVNGLFGGTGFGAYAAANAVLDGWAEHWAATGRRAQSLAWSMWDGPGMNQGSPLVAAARHRGLGLIDPARGTVALLGALHTGAVHLLIGADPANEQIKPFLAADQLRGGTIAVAVVPRPGEDPQRVRAAVATRLAGQGIFARVAVTSRIERDRGGVPDPAAVLAALGSGGAGYVAPEGRLEELVAGAAADVLGVSQVGRDDSFFSLGCDSVRAVQLAEALSERLGGRVSVGSLYESPTVRSLAVSITP